MKKLFLFATLALFGAMNAQTKFGVKAGYSLSTIKDISDDVSLVSDGKSSFYFGGLVEHKLNDKFAVQGELLYSPMGGKYSESESSPDYSYFYENDLKIGVLQVPVGAKYYVNENFALGAGLNFGFILSAKSYSKESLTISGMTRSESGNEDVKDQAKTLNLAPFVGAEYNINNGLFFDIRYNFGVSDLQKDSDVTSKMSFFQIGIGYKFAK